MSYQTVGSLGRPYGLPYTQEQINEILRARSQSVNHGISGKTKNLIVGMLFILLIVLAILWLLKRSSLSHPNFASTMPPAFYFN